MSIRSIKERARRKVHATMADPALYRASPESEWVSVTVRIHEKWIKFGDLPGMDGAQVIDISPRAVFLVEEIPGGKPQRGAIVSIVTGEAWRIGETDRADDITVTASVVHLSEEQAAGLPVPDAA